ncbi:MAG TPA: hypothetical protein VFN61_04560 [Acidimicrobiales bacterium]|nr:hypothetical protein [Acidimicrobiales bacterium]
MFRNNVLGNGVPTLYKALNPGPSSVEVPVASYSGIPLGLGELLYDPACLLVAVQSVDFAIGNPVAAGDATSIEYPVVQVAPGYWAVIITSPSQDAYVTISFHTAPSVVWYVSYSSSVPVPGEGATFVKAVPNPAVGADFTFDLPFPARLKGAQYQLTCAAVAANRFPALQVSPVGAGSSLIVPMAANPLTSGQSAYIGGFPGASPIEATGASPVLITASLPDLFLQSGIVASYTQGLQSTDQITNINLVLATV